MYIIFEQELRDLAEGKIKVEDLTTPEKQALITWSGEEVKEILKEKEIEFDLQEAVRVISHVLEDCNCAMCVKCAFDVLEDEIAKEIQKAKGFNY